MRKVKLGVRGAASSFYRQLYYSKIDYTGIWLRKKAVKKVINEKL